jgi:hypothetical protein
VSRHAQTTRLSIETTAEGLYTAHARRVVAHSGSYDKHTFSFF